MIDVKSKVRKGYLIEIPLYWKNPDGTPLNLSPFSARAQLRKKFYEKDGSTALTTFTSSTPSAAGDSITITPNDGKVLISFDPTSTAAFVGGEEVYWELQILNASGQPVRGVTGQFIILPTVFHLGS